MRVLTISIFGILFFSFSVIAQEPLNGLVKDSKKKPLPYTNVYWKKSITGTLTNFEGKFQIPSPFQSNDTLCFELLGYELVEIPQKMTSAFIEVKLKPKAFELKEVVVKPQPPTYYIKQAVKAMPQNFDSSAYCQKSYYRELVKENGITNKMVEAILLSQTFGEFGEKKDSVQVVLMHGRKASAQATIAFMQSFVEKKKSKEVKKLKRKGKEIPEELEKEGGANIDFGGPIFLLGRNFLQQPDEFLDSNKFKRYDFSFDEVIEYKGRPTSIISFKQKKRVNKPLFDGKIYLDEWDNAISVLEFELSEAGKKHIIPTLYKPIMWAMGLGVGTPDFKIQIFAKKVGDFWYTDYFRFQGFITATKTYWFKDNEESTFEMDQLLKVLLVDENLQNQIPNYPRVTNESLYKQVSNKADPFWDNFKL